MCYLGGGYSKTLNKFFLLLGVKAPLSTDM